MPEETGVRISSATGESGAPALELSVAEGPLPEDEVIEVQGARVSWTPTWVPALRVRKSMPWSDPATRTTRSFLLGGLSTC